MRIINLLPPEAKNEYKYELVSHKVLAFWTWIALSLLVFYGLSFGTAYYLKSIISDTDQQIVVNKQLLSSSNNRDLQEQILILNKNIQEVNILRSQHYLWSNALLKLSNLVPAGMEFNQLILNSRTGKIDVTGQAETRDDVLLFWSNVLHSSDFKDINFPLANLEKARIVNFSFSFNVDKTKFIAK
jgi:hypothetical protein